MENNHITGWININKPSGITSFKVIAKLRRITGIKKIGHAGTLDPLASGILPVAIGRETTKTISTIVMEEKVYIFRAKWGKAYDTGDKDGRVIKENGKIPTRTEIINSLSNFIGNIKQKPHSFSAVKIDGKKSYELARKGIMIDLPEKDIAIKGIFLVEHSGDSSLFQIRCSKGTYVRSLIRDIADKIGVLGYIDYLHRAEVGNFTMENSVRLEDINIYNIQNFLIQPSLTIDML